MSIDKTTLEKLAFLAKIELKDEEIPNYLSSFNKLLSALTSIQEVDCSGIPSEIELFSEKKQFMRDDVVTDRPDVTLLQQNAPRTLQHFYLVPKVIEGESS
jgi:aspartyl-tRNA(Asn)/glutamyl-tRNA(Gln) amidotransferase subunit C